MGYKYNPLTGATILHLALRTAPGLALHRGWARPMSDRCLDLAQHANQPYLMAAEVTDADDERARAFYHHTHPSGNGG